MYGMYSILYMQEASLGIGSEQKDGRWTFKSVFFLSEFKFMDLSLAKLINTLQFFLSGSGMLSF